MERKLVTIKGIGVQDSLLLILDDQIDFSTLIEYIERKLEEADDFFAGAEVIVDLGQRRLGNSEKIRLIELLEEHYGLNVHNFVRADHMLYPETYPEEAPPEEEEDTQETFFLRTTVRSGQEIKHDGNIVIMGDINPGAEVIASGNILVFGTVRGVIHAGATGDREAFICAVRLEPIQLRIADLIARAPDSENSGPGQPEIGEIVDDHVVIRSLSDSS